MVQPEIFSCKKDPEVLIYSRNFKFSFPLNYSDFGLTALIISDLL